MSDLKFKCSTCGQPIVVDSKDSGRKLACPSCRTQLTVPKTKPEAAKPEPKPEVPAGKKTSGATAVPAEKETATAKKKTAPPPLPPEPPKARASESIHGHAGAAQKPAEAAPKAPKPPADPPKTPPVKLATKPTPAASAAPTPAAPAAPATPAAPKAAPTAPAVPAVPKIPAIPSAPPAPTATKAPKVAAAVPAVAIPASPAKEPDPDDAEPQPVQLGVLTSELKLEAVRGARACLADSGKWMPGRSEDGRLAYAAIKNAEGFKSVEVGSEEAAQATHFSLMGAILSEIHRLKVTPTAKGRVDFLDGEIPEALWLAVQGGSGEASEKIPDSTDPRLMKATHEQCLAALDRLEQKLAEEVSSGKGSTSVKEVHGSTIEDLMLRASRDEVVTTNELLRSVHREVVEVRRRLADLEKAASATPAP